jgi:phosphate-selective porin OprO/OprP
MGAALATLAAGAGPARADEEREKELENRVRDLEQRLEEVASSVRGGYFTANSDLDARVSELERMAADDKGGLNTIFKTGLRMESGDKAFTYQIYGRVQNDWVWWDSDDDVEGALDSDLNGGTNFRRVRMGMQGTMYGNVKWKSEFDFANSTVEFADVFMELTGCAFGNVRVGHFDEPFGLDRLTSSRFTTFIERNVCEAFAPQRNTGIMFYGNAMEERLGWQAGMFRDSDVRGGDVGNTKSGEYNLTARLAGRPILQDDGATFLHVGGAASYRDYSNDVAAFSQRPGVRVGTPTFLDQSVPGAEDGVLLGLEAAFQTGSLCFKAEYASASGNGGDIKDGDGITIGDQEDFDFDSFSFEVSYWLTGDSNGYDKVLGRFDRPKLKRNFGDGDGMGGWQVALAWETIDMADGGLDFDADGNAKHSEMDLIKVGVNWWLNPNTRVSMNVIQADQEAFDVDVTSLVMRFQVDF